MKSLGFSILFLFLCTSANVVLCMESSQSKQKILEEFRKKLLEEEEIQRELKKNVTLTNEDFNDLVKNNDEQTLKDVFESIKPTEEEKKLKEEAKKKAEEEKKRKAEEKKKIAEEEKKLKEEEKRIKAEEKRLKDEEKKQKKAKTEEEKKQKKEEEERLKKEKDELKQKQDELERSKKEQNSGKTSKTTNAQKQEQDQSALSYREIDSAKPGVLEKIYNITDTGVSNEFLYSREYQELISNKTTITKVDTNKESDIPVVYLAEKNIISFDNTDIPNELLTYKRSTENRHIPTIMSTADMQEIAIKAIENNNLSVLRGVIEQTKDPDFLIDRNRTLLNFAIESKKYILARYLIYSGASINRLDNKLNNPLHVSVINHSSDIADLLMENGVDINAQNIDGDTPLLLSIATSQDDLTIKLLKNGANLRIKNKQGDDAVSLAIKNNKRKIQQYLQDIIRQEEMNK